MFDRIAWQLDRRFNLSQSLKEMDIIHEEDAALLGLGCGFQSMLPGTELEECREVPVRNPRASR
ncbi:MAG: hypothetical protein KDJ19_13125 [Hyphomicrobiaceae bacterium]|nr:hypothetical protein [Hyphomicrobiaceae bacterium]